MKRHYLIAAAMLALLALPEWKLAAQEQEDHIVVRRRYSVEEVEKEPNTSPWYNNFSFGFVAGRRAKSVINNAPSSVDKNQLEYNDDSKPAFVFGYERLYNNGRYYYGPGLHLKFGDDLFGIDAYLNGRIEFGGIGTVLGFNLDKLHPYAGASLGLSLLTNYETDDWSFNGVELSYNYIDFYGEYEDTGIKLYADLSLGLNYKISNHMSVSACYYAALMPFMYCYQDYGNLIPEQEIDLNHSTRPTIHHGAQLSFWF